MPRLVHPKLPNRSINVGDAQVAGWERSGWQLADTDAPAIVPPPPVGEDAQPPAAEPDAPANGDKTPEE